jgi:biotin-dependent carboxylase-like uncharacterized protein
MTRIRVVKPGMLSTVQDLGRWGHQDRGVPVAGPMDSLSLRLANRILGNPKGAAGLEITLIGPDLEFEDSGICAVTGADLSLTIDGRPAPMYTPVSVRAGARLWFGARRSGTRAYLGFAGGLDIPPVLGSRATHLVSRTGPFGGRALKTGDLLSVGRPTSGVRACAVPPMPLPAEGARLRVMWGPQDEMFTAAARQTLVTTRYRITPQSDRMGYRLDGLPLQHAGSADILSDATPIGTLQVPASGQPILLMADRQTTGGYPKIATVITADLAAAGQLGPGDWLEFEACDRRTALEALRAQEERLERAVRE